MKGVAFTVGMTAFVMGVAALSALGITKLVVGVSIYGWRYALFYLVGAPLILFVIPWAVVYSITKGSEWLARRWDLLPE